MKPVLLTIELALLIILSIAMTSQCDYSQLTKSNSPTALIVISHCVAIKKVLTSKVERGEKNREHLFQIHNGMAN